MQTITYICAFVGFIYIGYWSFLIVSYYCYVMLYGRGMGVGFLKTFRIATLCLFKNGFKRSK